MNPTMHNDEYDFDPSQYQMPGVQILPQPGEYAVRLNKPLRAKDKNTGQEALADGIFPTLIFTGLEIVEPTEEAGKFRLNWQRVGSKPFQRNGKLSSGVADLMYAIDPSLGTQVEGSSPQERWADIVRIVEQELASGQIIHVKLGYFAQDLEQAKADGGTTEAYKKNKYYTKAFGNPKTGYSQTVVTPQGKVLQAQLNIDSFVAVPARSSDPGPFGRKR